MLQLSIDPNGAYDIIKQGLEREVKESGYETLKVEYLNSPACLLEAVHSGGFSYLNIPNPTASLDWSVNSPIYPVDLKIQQRLLAVGIVKAFSQEFIRLLDNSDFPTMEPVILQQPYAGIRQIRIYINTRMHLKKNHDLDLERIKDENDRRIIHRILQIA